MLSEIKIISDPAHSKIIDPTFKIEDKTNYILGEGHNHMTTQSWSKIQTKIATFLLHITLDETITESNKTK